MELRLRHIREVWDRVKPVLEEFASWKNVEWRPEDIYALCVNEQADIYINDDDEFIIMMPFINQYTLKREMMVMVGYSKLPGAQDRHLPQMRELAKSAGATRLVMHSRRPGFEVSKHWTKLDSRYAVEL